MDPQSLYLREHKVPELVDGLICKLVASRPANPRQFLADELATRSSQGADVDDYPPFASGGQRAPVVIQGVLTREMHSQLKGKRTGQGVSLEECIVDGMRLHWALGGGGSAPDDGPAAPPAIGFYPGDEESVMLFEPLTDGVLYERVRAAVTAKNGGRRKSSTETAVAFLSTLLPVRYDLAIPPGQVGYSIDENLCLAAAVKLRRNVRPFRLAPTMSRGERAALQALLQLHLPGALQRTAQPHPGQYVRLHDDKPAPRRASMAANPTAGSTQLNADKASALRLLPQPSPLVANAAREFPAQSGYFAASDWSVVVAVGTKEEHVEIGAVALHNNLREAFEVVHEISTAVNASLQGTSEAGATGKAAGAASPSSSGWMLADKYGGYVTCNLDFFHSGLSFAFILQLPNLLRYEQLAAVLEKLYFRREANVPSTQWSGPGIVTLESCIPPLLLTPSEALQLVATNVNMLLDMESMLDCGSSIDKKVEILLGMAA